MLIRKNYNKFIKKWKHNLPNKHFLFDYKNFCSDLLYQKEEIVIEITNLLKKNIELWAKEKSEIYKKLDGIICKENLLEKEKWFVKELSNESKQMKTSGSTTSIPFNYLRWDVFLDLLECENHYDLILDEFNIKNNFNLFYFFNNPSYDRKSDFTVKNSPKNFMECHGKKRNVTSHYVNFNELQKSHPDYYKKILDYCIKNKINVIFCPGSVTNSLRYHIKKNNIKDKICNLLSNSYEEILNKDIDYLLNNNLIDNVCDHMRCWDGGSTFFTCKYKTYHLLDNLSWCYEYDQKLISIDYFSLPSPFVNYWNGDYCKIGNNYKRCKCGRLYRPFEFLKSRPFSIKGKSVNDINNILLSLNIKGIKQIRCSEKVVTIICSIPIPENKQQDLAKSFENLNFNFVLEN